MEYEAAVQQAAEISRRVVQPAFIHVLNGDYNFRFIRPIECVVGTEGTRTRTVAWITANAEIFEGEAFKGLVEHRRALNRSNRMLDIDATYKSWLDWLV